MSTLRAQTERESNEARQALAAALVALAIVGGLLGSIPIPSTARATDELDARDRWYREQPTELASGRPAPTVADRWYLEEPASLAARSLAPTGSARDRWYLDPD